MSLTTANFVRALGPPPPDDVRGVTGYGGPRPSKWTERIFGKAAVWGWRSMFSRGQQFEIEIDPATGRETLLSLLTRRQNELRP